MNPPRVGMPPSALMQTTFLTSATSCLISSGSIPAGWIRSKPQCGTGKRITPRLVLSQNAGAFAELLIVLLVAGLAWTRLRRSRG